MSTGAPRAKKSGLSADIQKKLDAKYSVEQEKQCRAWIDEVIGDTSNLSQCGYDGEQVGSAAFALVLHDGKILIRLLNKLIEETKPEGMKQIKINSQSMPFKQMENIDNFIQNCKKFGLHDGDLFQTADLFESQNMSQVIMTLYALSTNADKQGYQGLCIGTKLAESNVRDFDEATMNAGKHIIGGQAGFTGGDSQKGMNMGKTRKVCD